MGYNIKYILDNSRDIFKVLHQQKLLSESI